MWRRKKPEEGVVPKRPDQDSCLAARWAGTCIFSGASACGLKIDVREFHIFDGIAGNRGEDGGLVFCCVKAIEIADENPFHCADFGGLPGAAQTRTEAHEKRPGVHVAHGGVGDGDVFKQGTIDGLEGVSLAAFHDAVGDGDIDEAAVGFGSTLDAAVVGQARIGRKFLEGAVEHGA